MKILGASGQGWVVAISVFQILSAATFAGETTANTAATATSAPAATAATSDLDQKGIHAAYNDGDFETVLTRINQFTAVHKSYTHSDSLFIFKHLAVVYTANPQTREKGKYYMYHLLEMLPSAELVDMFVSDEVDRIFEKVRREFLVRQQKNFGVDSTQVVLPNKAPASTAMAQTQSAPKPAESKAPEPKAQPKKSEGIDPVWYWVTGGVVAMSAGVLAVILMSPSSTQGKTYVVAAANN